MEGWPSGRTSICKGIKAVKGKIQQGARQHETIQGSHPPGDFYLSEVVQMRRTSHLKEGDRRVYSLVREQSEETKSPLVNPMLDTCQTMDGRLLNGTELRLTFLDELQSTIVNQFAIMCLDTHLVGIVFKSTLQMLINRLVQ